MKRQTKLTDFFQFKQTKRKTVAGSAGSDDEAISPPPQPAPPAEPPWPAVNRPDAPRPELCVRPAKRFLKRNAYRMISEPRGLALIISNTRFCTDVHDDREGGELDEVALESLLRQLGFEVQVERDLNLFLMGGAIAAFAKSEEHRMYDMAVLAVLTHGGKDVIYGVDSRPLDVEDRVIKCFSNEAAPYLAGKPKWLLLQACRGLEGNRAVKAVDPNRRAVDGSARVRHDTNTVQMAEVGDIYLTYSSIPGYVSLRDLDSGAWLVQILCKVFAEHAHCRDLQELHTMVHERMDEMIAPDMITSKKVKQTIETAQRGWRKKLYFNPGLRRRRSTRRAASVRVPSVGGINRPLTGGPVENPK